MIEITSQGPVNRHITEFLTSIPGVKHFKCKTLQNPDYFFDGRSYGSVDVSHKLDTSTEKAGGLWLRNKAIVSVGTKKADDAYKLFGLRPDENQGGSESVEWSVESIEINGKAQTINLKDRIEVSPITTKFGDNLYVQRARQRCRIMVPGDSSTESFNLIFRLHLKGATVEYRKDLDEYWIYRGGMFFCRLGHPYLVDPDTMNPVEGSRELVKHSLTEISKGEYRYIKEPTEAFAKADLPAAYLIDADTVYSSTADGYVLYQNANWDTCHNAGTGSFAYTEDTIIYGMYARWTGAAFEIDRSFFYHDTSGVVGTISAASQFIRGYTSTPTSGCVLAGTQADSLGTADFDAFGELYGSVATWVGNAYNEIVFNAAGIAGINQTGVTKLCDREYAHDYLNSSPGTDTYRNGMYMADDTSGTKDPYLYITTAAAAGLRMKVNVSGLPKTVSASKIMVGGQWKSISAAKIMVGGQWKTV